MIYKMTNCIFVSTPENNNIYMFLDSLYTCGNIGDTDIIIYTTEKIAEEIKASDLYCDNIHFEINDKLQNFEKSIIDLFSLKDFSKYEKVLCLESSTVISNDLNKVFDSAMYDVVYTVEEGVINDPSNKYGANLFSDEELAVYGERSAFGTKIILFKNNEIIRDLFEKMIVDFDTETSKINANLVYTCVSNDMYDNTVLKDFFYINPKTYNTSKYINYFDNNENNDFLLDLKKSKVMDIMMQAKSYINENLWSLIVNSGSVLEGNLFTEHNVNHCNGMIYTDRFYEKIENICWLSMNKNIKKVLEIGFNSGFSALLMLLSNPNLQLDCVDINWHKYTSKCFNQLRETFGERLNIAYGDSVKTLTTLSTDNYDMVHIDGGHEAVVACADIVNSYRLANNRSILVFDDYDFPYLKPIWDRYVQIYNLKKTKASVNGTLFHDAKFKCEF